jgi:predicted NBD/HSP70 family sugar kinase
MNYRTNPPPVLRQISVRAAMDVLLQKGPTSRADLAKKTGLSKQTMSEVIRALEESGWVRVKGVISGKVGRSAVTYEVAPDAAYVIGIDLGANTVRFALASIAGTVVFELERPAAGKEGQALLRLVEEVVADGLAAAGVARDKILLAAVATPGAVDPETGTLSLAPNLGGVASINVVKALSDSLDCAVIIENDVNAAVIGESWLGCAAGIDTGAFISLGTGIGLGMMINGKLVRGAHGTAGEISYLPFGADPLAPESLERGALECAIGARGIMERYRDASAGATVSVREILERAEGGEAAALAVISETSRLAALLVVSVDAMIDPQKIILGGNVGRHRLIVEAIHGWLGRMTRRTITVEASTLATRATMLGAVAIALNQLHNTLFSPQDLPSELRLPQNMR